MLEGAWSLSSGNCTYIRIYTPVNTPGTLAVPLSTQGKVNP